MEIKKDFPIKDYPGFDIFSPEGLQFMTLAGKETDLESVHELIHKVADVINTADINNATAAIAMIALLCATYDRFVRESGKDTPLTLPFSLN